MLGGSCRCASHGDAASASGWCVQGQLEELRVSDTLEAVHHLLAPRALAVTAEGVPPLPPLPPLLPQLVAPPERKEGGLLPTPTRFRQGRSKEDAA